MGREPTLVDRKVGGRQRDPAAAERLLQTLRRVLDLGQPRSQRVGLVVLRDKVGHDQIRLSQVRSWRSSTSPSRP
jgi:hypothetical protein